MATTNPVNGTAMALYIDESGTLRKIGNLVSNDFDISADMIEVSSKSSAGWKEFIAGDKGATFSFEGIYEEDASLGTSERSFGDLYTLLTGTNSLTLVFTTNSSGDDKYSAACLLSNLKISSPYNDKVTFSGTAQITGAITKGTVS